MSDPSSCLPVPQSGQAGTTTNFSTSPNNTPVNVTRHSDGSGTMKVGNNTVIERDSNGNFNLNFTVLRRVEIADIMAVVSHQINRVLNSTSHVIHFVGGGYFTIAYDQRGNVLSSNSRKIVCSFSDDGVIRLERSLLEHEQSRTVFGGKEL